MFLTWSMSIVWDGKSLYDALTRPGFAYSFDKNKAAFNIAHNTDMGYYEYMRSSMDQTAQERLALSMKGIGALASKGVPESYPWESLGKNATIVDVGGGTGHILMPVLRQFPQLKLVVQDLEAAISVGHKVATKSSVLTSGVEIRVPGGSGKRSCFSYGTRFFHAESCQGCQCLFYEISSPKYHLILCD